MSRPKSTVDLPESARYAPVVTVHSMGTLHLDGDAMRELAQLCDLLMRSEWLSVGDADSDHVVYVRHRISDEMRESLKEAQRRWDWQQSLYARAAAGEVLEAYQRYLVDEHARSEGLDPIDWDALDAAEAADGGEGL